MSLVSLSEALKQTISYANEAVVYTHTINSVISHIEAYITLIQKSEISKGPISSSDKPTIEALTKQLNSFSNYLQNLSSLSWPSISLEKPVSEPLTQITCAMDLIYNSLKSLKIECSKFTISNSILADDFIALYGIFATPDDDVRAGEKLSEVKSFMEDHGISLPGAKINVTLEDFFSSLSKFKLKHSKIRKGKLRQATREGDFYNGKYHKRKVTIMEIPEFNMNIENYQREVASLSSISHPNIIEFIGATSTEPYWIVTTRLGRPLRYYLKRQGKANELTPVQKTIIAYKVAEAMAYIHSKNIIHRDLSAQSIVLDRSKNPYVINFSASRFIPEDDSLLLTVGVGNEICKAPEMTNDSRYGLEVDVFSYGMLLYEMLTGKQGFASMSQTEAANAILCAARPEIPAGTSPYLSSLIKRCWSPLAKDRPTFISILNELPSDAISFPDADPLEISNFYSTVCVMSSDVQCCIDLINRICTEINDVIAFKHEAIRVRALLNGYLLELKNAEIARTDFVSIEACVDINNLISALQRLSMAIKNMSSPIWERNVLSTSALLPMEDLNDAVESIYVPLFQLGLAVQKYEPNRTDLSLDFRFLYNTFLGNNTEGLNMQKKIDEIEAFMSKNGITVAPSQQEIDVKISAVFKSYDNFLVKHEQFEIGKKIGDGATSTVYLGIEKATGKKVAIKEFTKEYMATENCGFYLHREIAALATLRHEFLAKFIGATKSSPIWVISEYVEKGTLERYIKDGTLTPIQKTRIMYEIAEGIAYLHSMKMIHRDLKTNNVLLDSTSGPKIVDFGFTRPIFIAMSVRVGTPIYMAPEVIKSAYYDYKADVFSFALMIYEMIAGIKPFTNYCTDVFTIQQYILDGMRPMFEEEQGVSESMIELLDKMWADSYRDRPSFVEILQEMRDKKIGFPGASQDEVECFYAEKNYQLVSKPPSLNSKRNLSFFNL